MPHPESIVSTKASENELNVYRQFWSNIKNISFWAMKFIQKKNIFKINILKIMHGCLHNKS